MGDTQLALTIGARKNAAPTAGRGDGDGRNYGVVTGPTTLGALP